MWPRLKVGILTWLTCEVTCDMFLISPGSRLNGKHEYWQEVQYSAQKLKIFCFMIWAQCSGIRWQKLLRILKRKTLSSIGTWHWFYPLSSSFCKIWSKIQDRSIFQFQYIPFSIHYRDTLSNNSINMKIMHVFMISLHWSLVLDVSLMTTVVLKHQSP